MKAIIFTRDGFRKDIVVSKASHYLASLPHRMDIQLVSEELYGAELVPIIRYELIRGFTNEYDEEVLVYREMR